MTHPSFPFFGRFLRYAVYGMNDGLVSNLALVAALSGAAVFHGIILLGGLAAMFSGAVSMGLGAYISAKSQNEYYRREIATERVHVDSKPALGKQELQDIYREKGFSGKQLDMIVNKIMFNKTRWLRELTEGRLGLGEQSFDNPWTSAFVTFFAFVVGAFVPLVPFAFITTSQAFIFSLGLSVLILFVAGAGKTHYTKRNWIKSGVEMIIVGLLGAGVSYYFGEFVGSILLLL